MHNFPSNVRARPSHLHTYPVVLPAAFLADKFFVLRKTCSRFNAFCSCHSSLPFPTIYTSHALKATLDINPAPPPPYPSTSCLLRIISRVSCFATHSILHHALARTTEATKRLAFRDEATQWHAKCTEQEHRTFKWKRRVERETKFFNGRALTGRYQR